MKSAAHLAGPLLALLCAVVPASAQQPSQAQVGAIRQSCPADYQKYCASVPTGGQASLACLQQNASRLSAACRQAVSALGGGSSGGAAVQPTTPAARPPAASAPATRAASAPATRAAPPMSPRQQATLLRQACGHDYGRYCRGVPFGGGRVASCLQGNADRLTPNCGRALYSLRHGR